jgi:hypothetical protein
MFYFAATAVLAAGSVVAATLRRRETGTDREGRQRGDTKNNFRDSFHCNSPFDFIFSI